MYRVNDVLIMGDTAQSYKDGSLTPVAEKYADDPALAEQSLVEFAQRVSHRDSEIEFIAFSHSGPLSGLEPLLAYASSKE